MSYLRPAHGPGLQGGFGYYGLGAVFPIGSVSEPLRAVQRELGRIGYLQQDASSFGADGRWGPRTATALRAAANYVHWSSAAYSPANADALQAGQVTVPDELIAQLRAAQPDPAAHPAGSDATTMTSTVQPGPEQAPAPLPMDVVTDSGGSSSGWVPAALIGGGVLLVGGIIMMTMRQPRRAVAANRRRRRRR